MHPSLQLWPARGISCPSLSTHSEECIDFFLVWSCPNLSSWWWFGPCLASNHIHCSKPFLSEPIMLWWIECFHWAPALFELIAIQGLVTTFTVRSKYIELGTFRVVQGDVGNTAWMKSSMFLTLTSVTSVSDMKFSLKEIELSSYLLLIRGSSTDERQSESGASSRKGIPKIQQMQFLKSGNICQYFAAGTIIF